MRAEEATPGFAGRLAEWEADIRPASPEARHALRQAVAATFRLERCQVAYGAAVAEHSAPVREAWDDDRLAEAAALLAGLARRPEVVAPRLRASAQGAALMLRIWRSLGEALEAEAGEWSAEQLSTACDLLGIPTHLRDGRLPFDPADPAATPADRLELRREFVRRESEDLAEAVEGRLARLDKAERALAESGASAMQAKSVKLVLRYEAAAASVVCRVARRREIEHVSARLAPMGRAGRLPEFARPPDDRPAPSPPRTRSPPAPEAPPTRRSSTRSCANLRASASSGSRAEDDIDSDDESEADAEPELATAGVSAPPAPAGKALNRRGRRRRDALARHGG